MFWVAPHSPLPSLVILLGVKVPHATSMLIIMLPCSHLLQAVIDFGEDEEIADDVAAGVVPMAEQVPHAGCSRRPPLSGVAAHLQLLLWLGGPLLCQALRNSNN